MVSHMYQYHTSVGNASNKLIGTACLGYWYTGILVSVSGTGILVLVSGTGILVSGPGILVSVSGTGILVSGIGKKLQR